RRIVGVRRDAHASQEDVLQPSDETGSRSEGNAVSHDCPKNGDNSHHREALHHRAQDIFSAYKAAIEKRQSGSGHEQNESRTGEHPGIVTGALCAGHLLFEIGNALALLVGGGGGWARASRLLRTEISG